jgi:hypothetical protein
VFPSEGLDELDDGGRFELHQGNGFLLLSAPQSLVRFHSWLGMLKWQLRGLVEDGGDIGLCSPPVDNSECGSVGQPHVILFITWRHGLGISRRAACASKIRLSFAVNSTKLQLDIYVLFAVIPVRTRYLSLNMITIRLCYPMASTFATFGAVDTTVAKPTHSRSGDRIF